MAENEEEEILQQSLLDSHIKVASVLGVIRHLHRFMILSTDQSSEQLDWDVACREGATLDA